MHIYSTGYARGALRLRGKRFKVHPLNDSSFVLSRFRVFVIKYFCFFTLYSLRLPFTIHRNWLTQRAFPVNLVLVKLRKLVANFEKTCKIDKIYQT